MVIAALVSFGILLVAWILAPDQDSRRHVPPIQAPEAVHLAA